MMPMSIDEMKEAGVSLFIRILTAETILMGQFTRLNGVQIEEWNGSDNIHVDLNLEGIE